MVRNMNFETGTVLIDGVEIGPGYSFHEFCKSPFYKQQDGIRTIPLEGIKYIDGNHYHISLCFREATICFVSLICCDKEFTKKTEYQRKELHDQILTQYSIAGEKEFWWGKVTSEYDRRSNISSIDLIYNIDPNTENTGTQRMPRPAEN